MGIFILSKFLLFLTNQDIDIFMVILIVISVIVIVGGIWIGYRSYKYNNDMNKFRK
jgi:hypothetical protein